MRNNHIWERVRKKCSLLEYAHDEWQFHIRKISQSKRKQSKESFNDIFSICVYVANFSLANIKLN